MHLIIDIGNTRGKLLAFDEQGNPKAEAQTDGRTLEGLADFAQRNDCRQGIISSTIGLTQAAERQLCGLPFEVLRLTGKTPLPIRNLYRTPDTLGTDRLAAVVGAWTMQPRRNLLVVDCGTCITYDFIDSEGNYWGGNISPGLNMRLKALHEQTARLPLVSPSGETPDMGFDTDTAIRSGVIQGIRHEIEGYIRQMKEKYTQVSVFLTGGDTINLAFRSDCTIFADNFIVPRGLNQILVYNL